MATALATAVGLRVFDRVDAPAFLIQHPIVQHAADRQLRIVLDRIILQVFVPAIAIDQVTPLGVPTPDLADGGQGDGGGLDIQWFVILDDSDRRLATGSRRLGTSRTSSNIDKPVARRNSAACWTSWPC